ncbi:MAG: hypothetical protein JWM64_1213 [Frankiales bacterium]|nr:hypothetical protein [Frankiales bacterium]
MLRRALIATTACALLSAPALSTSSTATAAPFSKVAIPDVEALASYVGQSVCDPVAKPGVLAASKLILAAYPGTASSGIVRACAVGARSEHKEGRAFDWRLNAAVASNRAAAADFTRWLFATDALGNRYANARRLGVMYIIWNKKIWRAYDTAAGWKPYTGANPHTDHMHISFSWAGARKTTSYWTGVGVATRPVTMPVAPAAGPTTATPAPTTADDGDTEYEDRRQRRNRRR